MFTVSRCNSRLDVSDVVQVRMGSYVWLACGTRREILNHPSSSFGCYSY